MSSIMVGKGVKLPEKIIIYDLRMNYLVKLFLTNAINILYITIKDGSTQIKIDHDTWC